MVQISDRGKERGGGGKDGEKETVRLAFHEQVHIATSCRASGGCHGDSGRQSRLGECCAVSLWPRMWLRG